MKEQQIVFGWHAVLAALEGKDCICNKLYLIEPRQPDNKYKKAIILAEERDIPVFYLSRQLLDKMADTDKHQGILAYCQPMPTLQENDIPRLLERFTPPYLILILDQLQDPHNLGAIFRTADAAGVNFIIAPRDNMVGITGVVKKVASGAVESVPYVTVTNLARTLRLLKQHGVWLYGLTEAGQATIYQTAFLDSIGLVMGSEGSGLRENTRKQCDRLISIPMAGSVSSLNVSVATGVALYEVIRQRCK